MLDPVFFCATAALLLVGQPAPAQSRAPLECSACNGSPLLCDKRYNEVAYPTTHGAMSCRDEHWIAANQHHNIARQLDDGVRALMLEVHYLFGKTYLARGNAVLNRKPLAEGLGEVRAFMRAQPCEVITLLFKSHIRAADMAAALQSAGLVDSLYAHTPGQPFPTLKEMVLSGRRLVIFTDHEGGAYPWYHAMSVYCSETAEKARRPTDLTSWEQRGTAPRPLCILNHYLAAPLASPSLTLQVNYNPFFLQRVENFVRDSRRTPNFVVVDYYDLGALFEVVDTVNGLPWPQRRQGKPAPDVQSATFDENGESLRSEQLIGPDVPLNGGS